MNRLFILDHINQSPCKKHGKTVEVDIILVIQFVMVLLIQMAVNLVLMDFVSGKEIVTPTF